MRRYKHYKTIGYLTVFATLVCLCLMPAVYAMAATPQNAAVQSSVSANTATDATPATASSALTNPALYCPSAKELKKEGLFWVIGNDWKSYSESFVNEVETFVGAQWVGVRVGKIICLYRGKGATDFPIALEQVVSQVILEPKSVHWSSLVSNRKFCQSTNIFDCPYFSQPKEQNIEPYESIKYKPQIPVPGNS